MKNLRKGTLVHMVLNTIVGIVGIVVTIISILVTCINIQQNRKDKENQNSNHPSPR